MKRQFLALTAVGALALSGCATDPTSAISGTAPATIQASANLLFLNEGDSVLVTAETHDQQGGVLSTLPTATAGDAGVAVLDVSEPPLSQARFYVRGVTPGASTVALSAGSASATIDVVVFPLAFGGAVSVSTANRLDEVTVMASAAVTFDSSASEVTINGEATRIISRTDQQIVVQALTEAATTGATVTISNVVFLVGTANETPIASIDAASTVNISGEPDEPSNDSRATATVITLGSTTTGSVSGSDASDYFQVTLAGAQTLNITAAFTSGPDIDILLYDATGAVVDVAFTLNNPETISYAAAAGTYFIEINLYDGHGVAEPYWFDMTVN